MGKALEESSPLLGTNTNHHQHDPDQDSDPKLVAGKVDLAQHPSIHPTAQPQVGLVAQPLMARTPWTSPLCSCLGRNDHFCSSDLEVCLLGSIAPCVLYGSNAERLASAPGNFSNHCITYTALYLIGNSFFGWNCLAPWFSYTTRTAVRRRFNLEGGCEALNRQCGCCGGFVEDEVQREQCETACDFATHVLCHPCSLCQEAREIRRRLPHPGFNAQPPLIFMVPPGEQTMGR